MSNYQGIFVRDQIGQTPSSNTGAWSSSPDIILSGIAPVPDSTTFTTNTGYSTDYWETLLVNRPNYFYVRGLNTTASNWRARLWLYHATGDLGLWPQDWHSHDIWYQGKNQSWCTLDAISTQQVVAGGPLIWVPSPTMLSSDHHTCLILWAENEPVSDPPISPVPQAPLKTWEDLAVFILSHPNVGLRSCVDVSGMGPSWNFTVPIRGPQDSCEVNVGIQCHNMPVDGFVSVYMPGPRGQNIKINKHPIRSPNMSYMQMYDVWPGGFNTAMTIQFFQGNTPPPQFANITPILTIPATPNLDRIAMQFGRRASTFESYDLITLLRRPPIRAYTIGARPLVFFNP